MSRTYPFEPPIAASGLSCRHCGDQIVATGQVFDDYLSIAGLDQYEWRHTHGDVSCRPTTTAQPYDGWHATRIVRAAKSARRAAEDALLKACDE
jgi:hypothetical protein